MPLSKVEFADLVRRMPNASDEEILAAAKKQDELSFPGKTASVGAGPSPVERANARDTREQLSARPQTPKLRALDADYDNIEAASHTGLGQLANDLGAAHSKRTLESFSDPHGEFDRLFEGVIGSLAPENELISKLGQETESAAAGAAKVARKPRRGQMSLPLEASPESSVSTHPQTSPETPAAEAASPSAERIQAYHSPLPDYIKQQFENGKEGADWYAQAMPRIRQMLGDQADKIIDYFAATSPNATVKANTGFAVKALEQDKAAEPFTGYLGQSIDRLKKAKAGEPFGGLKVSAFTKALRGDPNAVVVDRWIARHWGLDKVTNKQYGEIADQITKHAQDMGVEPRQLQAALWVAAKKNWGRAGDTAAPFEEVLQDMIAQRKLFNPDGLVRKFPGDEGPLDLEHRSSTPGLTELDPTKFGSAIDQFEKRRLNYRTKIVPRTYYTQKGGAVEPMVDEMPFTYDAQVPNKSSIYDISKDPQGLIPAARKAAKEQWGDTSDNGTITMLERLIHENGYAGYRNSALEAPMRDTVAIFDKLGAKQRPGNTVLQRGAEDYIASEGLSPEQFAERVSKLNPNNMQKVAKAYDALEHKPDSPQVQSSYAALKKETKKQFDYIQQKLGIKLEPWTQEGQPYANSKEMMEDVGKNKRLFFFTGGDMPANHPLSEVDPDSGLTHNDMFRAIHDVFGHAQHGFQFGPIGEENAFRTHARMFSPDARGAMAMETKGQNSWVNFGPQAKGLAPAERPFAEQKANVLPDKMQKLSGAGAFGLMMKKVLDDDNTKEGEPNIGASHDAFRDKDIELPSDFGPRNDGRGVKGNGYFGMLQRPDGRASSELSMSFPENEINPMSKSTKEREIPLLVPTLNAKEVKALLSLKENQKVPDIIVRKAREFARTRFLTGKDPFAQTGEDDIRLLPELKRALPPK